MTRYAILTDTFVTGWVNCSTGEDGYPLTFATLAEAEQELADHLANSEFLDLNPDDYKIEEIKAMTNLEKAQQFALGQCLGTYPDDATYEEICGFIRDDTEDEDGDALVSVWEPFEYCDVVHIMENMVSAVTRLLDAQEVRP